MNGARTGRFLLALTMTFVAYDLGFSRAISVGVDRLGSWGIVVAVVMCGGLLALLFTAVYDGSRALLRLMRRPTP